MKAGLQKHSRIDRFTQAIVPHRSRQVIFTFNICAALFCILFCVIAVIRQIIAN